MTKRKFRETRNRYQEGETIRSGRLNRTGKVWAVKRKGQLPFAFPFPGTVYVTLVSNNDHFRPGDVLLKSFTAAQAWIEARQFIEAFRKMTS